MFFVALQTRPFAKSGSFAPFLETSICMDAFCRRCILRHDWFPAFSACRIGEATNPGPHLTITVSNPTSVNGKEEHYSNLPGQVHCISETALTQSMLDETTSKFRRHGFRCHWGAFVPGHRTNKCGIQTRRGMSSGVAILTKSVASRMCLHKMPSQWNSTCRLTECMIRVRSVDVKIICLYGFQSSAVDARAHTNALLIAALNRSQTFNGPCCIGGDFNFKPNNLESWSIAQSLGFHDLTQLSETRFPHKIFPTCKDSTNHDTLLVNTPLLHRFTDVEVHIDRKFDAHAPISFTFDLPIDGVYRTVWKMPCDISSLDLDKSFFQDAYNTLANNLEIENILQKADSDPDGAYHDWACLFENSAHLGLKRQCLAGISSQHRGLKQLHRGRGIKPKITHQQVPQSIKGTGKLAYHPETDSTTVKLRQWTKQVRRLQALISRLRKWEKTFGNIHVSHDIQDEHRTSKMQIFQEWDSIKNAKGFGMSFLEWISSPERLGFRFLQLPTFQGLEAMEKITRKECDAMAKRQNAERSKNFKVHINLDVLLFGGSFTYKLLRPHPKQPITSIAYEQEFEVKQLRCHKKLSPRVCIQPLDQLQIDQPLYIGDMVIPPPITVTQEGLVQLPHECNLTKPCKKAMQSVWLTSPPEIHACVADYWNTFWRRENIDKPLDDLPFEKALTIINDTIPQWEVIDVSPTANMYFHAANKMKQYAAKGGDGFSIGEIKLLHVSAWQHLHELMTRFRYWPKALTTCRTVMLPKEDVTAGPHSTRPITIAPIIYRIWASVHARIILQKWSTLLPPQISGGLPKRGTLDLMLDNMLQLESAVHHDQPLSGFVLDIEKAFNALPRICVLKAMAKMGVPSWLLDKWYLHLQGLVRCISIGDILSEGSPQPLGFQKETRFPLLR